MKKYPKLKRTEKLEEGEFYPGVFLVEEKIHGCNFQVSLGDAGLPTFASRNQVVTDDFMGAKEAMDKFLAKVPLVPDLIFFGELFGKGIKKGIFYSEEKEFLVFDIYNKKEERWLPPSELPLLIPISHLAPRLFVGTFQECIDFDQKFDSFIPTHLGGERRENNLCEGIVIKPFYTNLENKYGERLVWKKKNEKFSEVTPTPITEPTSIDHLLPYLNHNRIESFASKEGELTKEKMGIFIPGIAEDIVEDYGKEVSKEEMKALKKAIAKDLSKLL